MVKEYSYLRRRHRQRGRSASRREPYQCLQALPGHATGPDSIIDPKQLAFYVPGIGTPTARHDTMDRTKEAVRQMFGLGLIKKIIDCYVAILGVWQPGDRFIYLTSAAARIPSAVFLTY